MTDTLVEQYRQSAIAWEEMFDDLKRENEAQASRIAELEGAIVLASERMADLAVLIQPRHAHTVARWADELRKALEDKTLSNGEGV